MKKNFLVIVLGFMVNLGIFAQGYPVMDISSIVTAIQNGYTMVEQLQAMYNNLKTSYEQLQQQIKSFESFDFNTLDAKDPLGSWQSINTYANRMMTYEQNIEGIINRKDIKVGNGSYSLGDIFTSPSMTAQNILMDGINSVAIDPFENQLTAEEKTAFHRKFGMSFGKYTRLQHLGESLQKKAAEVVGYSGSLAEDLDEDRKKLDEIVQDVFGSESIIQQQQINNAVLTVMAQDIKTQANLLGDVAQQLAINFAQMMLEKQAMQDEININDLGLAEGFMKMLGEMQSLNDYK